MPTIKNGQYADITILAEHLNEKRDKILKDKYYMKGVHGYYIKYKGYKYYINRDKNNRIVTNGIVKKMHEEM